MTIFLTQTPFTGVYGVKSSHSPTPSSYFPPSPPAVKACVPIRREITSFHIKKKHEWRDLLKREAEKAPVPLQRPHLLSHRHHVWFGITRTRNPARAED